MGGARGDAGRAAGARAGDPGGAAGVKGSVDGGDANALAALLVGGERLGIVAGVVLAELLMELQLLSTRLLGHGDEWVSGNRPLVGGQVVPC